MTPWSVQNKDAFSKFNMRENISSGFITCTLTGNRAKEKQKFTGSYPLSKSCGGSAAALDSIKGVGFMFNFLDKEVKILSLFLPLSTFFSVPILFFFSPSLPSSHSLPVTISNSSQFQFTLLSLFQILPSLKV